MFQIHTQLQAPLHSPRQSMALSPLINPGKPKLSLNTTLENTKPRTFGKGSSLRLDTISAATPTTLNTFSNAYRHTPPPTRDAFGPPLPTPCSPAHSIDQVSILSPGPSSSLNSIIPERCPYTQYTHIKSVLGNTRYPSFAKKNIILPQRLLFPSPKAVSFRDPLSEEVITVKYTLAHSDFVQLSPPTGENDDSKGANGTSTTIPTTISPGRASSSEISPSHATSIPSSIPSSPSCAQLKVSLAPILPPRPSPNRLLRRPASPPCRSPRLLKPPPQSRLPGLGMPGPTTSAVSGQKRDSPASTTASSDSESDDIPVPQTPVAGRSKRRKWQWTLGPLPGHNGSNGEDDGDDNDGNPRHSREGSVVGDDDGFILSPDV